MTTQPLEPGFMLIHGNRAEELCDIAVKWLSQNPLRVLEPEVILVQSSGVAQWLQQKIAKSGIAAAIEFILPASFVWRAYKAVLSDSEIPEKSPLSKDRLVWQIFRLLDIDLDHGLAINNFLLGAEPRKKFQLAEHLASLYDQYQVYRADWLNNWQTGVDQISDRQGRLIDLPAEQLWQAELWRLILSDAESLYADVLGRAQIHQNFLDNLISNNESHGLTGLPRRIIVFGISTMPKQILEALVALSSHVQVLVFINNPCEYYWGDIQGQYEALRSSLKRQQKKPSFPLTVNEEDLHNHVQPLLASWGRQGRDFIAMLDDFDTLDRRQKSASLFARIDHKIDVFNKLPGINLLQQIQDDIRDLRSVQESKKWPPVNTLKDSSIEFHIAYSKQRELEVLHDQLLSAFNDDPELNPGDIIVMVPSIDSYAPHIEAVFGQYDIDDNRYLPFTIADIGQRNTDPLVVALETLLKIPDARFGAKEIMDLLLVPSLRNKFGIGLDDLPLIRLWIEDANIRWGLNQKHKSEFTGIATNNSNTWNFGLDRMLLGYATGDVGQDWENIYPYAEPGGIQAETLGYLAKLLDFLRVYRNRLKQDHRPDEWVELIANLVDDFFLPESTQDEATVLRFKQVLYDWLEVCLETGFNQEISIKIIADYCLAQLDQSFHAPRFFAGSVTFATLMPMRAIPFKYVCLLGMQDGEFPRNQTPVDFDLMAFYPKPGDRSRRDDDRYLFLEALLSARDKLYISWIGLNIVDGSEQPPSVLVSQLIDHIAGTWSCAQNKDLIGALTTEHPLQPFSKKYFWQSEEQADKYFTYANEWLYSDSTASDNKSLDNQSIDRSLNLSDIKNFLRDPVGYFYKNTLGVNFNDYISDLNEDESYELNHLDLWKLKDGLINALESDDHIDLAEYKNFIVQQGILPADSTATFIFRAVEEIINPVISVYMDNQQDWPNLQEPVRLSVELDNGLQFNDTIKNVRSNSRGELKKLVLIASNIVEVKARSAPRYSFKHIAPIWFEHVALNAWYASMETVLASPKGMVVFKPLDKQNAKSIWDQLWLAFDSGINQPIAASPGLSYKYLTSKHKDDYAALYTEINGAYEEELVNNMYLLHAFKDFADFFVSGEFIKWSEILYGDIRSNIEAFPINKS